MKDDVKVELKKLVEGLGLELYTKQMDAKEELKITCKSAEEVVGVKASQITKLIKTLYNASLEEDKAKFEEFNELYEEILG